MLDQSSIKFIMPKIFLCLNGKEYLDAFREVVYTNYRNGAGGTRTPKLRFSRPALYPISCCPVLNEWDNGVKDK